jgi:hypothetical protein
MVLRQADCVGFACHPKSTALNNIYLNEDESMIEDNLEELDLSQVEPPYSLEVWVRLAKSKEPSDRCEALEHLSDDAPDDIVAEFILDSLRDSDALVRTCAADAARLLRGMPKIVEALRLMVREETDELALAYSYASLGRLGDIQDIPLFVRGLDVITNARIRLDIVGGFCVLLRGVFLLDIYSMLKDNNSDILTVAVNGFYNVTEDEMMLEKDMLNAIESRLEAASAEMNSEDDKPMRRLVEILKQRTS